MNPQLATVLLTGTRSYTTIQHVAVDAGTTEEQLRCLANAMFGTLSPEDFEIETDFEWQKAGASAWISEGGEEAGHQARLVDGGWVITPVTKGTES